jgi:hypothetical protein
MPEQKKKIPKNLRYNNVDFEQIRISIDSQFIEQKRKEFRKSGHYTKVKKYGDRFVLYISKTGNASKIKRDNKMSQLKYLKSHRFITDETRKKIKKLEIELKIKKN